MKTDMAKGIPPQTENSNIAESLSVTASQLTCIAVLLSISKPGAKPRDLYGEAFDLLIAAREWLQNRLDGPTHRSVRQRMGWEVYTFGEISKLGLLGQHFTVEWIRKLVRRAFEGSRARAILNRGGLDQSELWRLQTFVKRSHDNELARKKRRRTKGKLGPDVVN